MHGQVQTDPGMHTNSGRPRESSGIWLRVPLDSRDPLGSPVKARRTTGGVWDDHILCHGKPIAMPADAQYVLDRCDIEGF
jgi:hypothetical protein